MAVPSRHWSSWLLLTVLGARLAVAGGETDLVSGLDYADRGGQRLLADVYVPAGAGPFPAVLCVHGGAWSGGNRLQMLGVATALREAGYVAVSIDYRLAPKASFRPSWTTADPGSTGSAAIPPGSRSTPGELALGAIPPARSLLP
jgi:pimeloyl-ACP methyl ester carboxylesterase